MREHVYQLHFPNNILGTRNIFLTSKCSVSSVVQQMWQDWRHMYSNQSYYDINFMDIINLLSVYDVSALLVTNFKMTFSFLIFITDKTHIGCLMLLSNKPCLLINDNVRTILLFCLGHLIFFNVLQHLIYQRNSDIHFWYYVYYLLLYLVC